MTIGCLMLSGGREYPPYPPEPYPRPSEPEPRAEPYEPRFPVLPIDSPVLPDSVLPDSADERGAIGENFCQPPLLLPLSRALVEPLGLDAEFEFELPRVSEPLSGPLLFLAFVLVFPGRAISRRLPVNLLSDAAVAPRDDEKKC